MQTTDPAAMIPKAEHVADLTPFPDWDAAMTAILQALSTGQYDKIVLARRKRFRFHRQNAPSPMHILAALDEQNRRTKTSGRKSDLVRSQNVPKTEHRSTYLFCLQLDSDKAFLGCTPERLFRLEGRSILAEALAGTVRRGTNGNEGEVLSELLSPKNLEEHRFVVDYIRTALSKCGVRAETNGPHVRRLPRLMHLATHIRGQFPAVSESAKTRISVESKVKPSKSNVFRLLRTMHPTPAVCGMPRERTITELEKLEDFDRGFFAGPLGWFSRDAGEFCVAIRSALVHGNNVTAFAGSGIVQASESKSEWDETELKMSAFTDLFQAGLQKGSLSPESPFLELVATAGSGDYPFHELQAEEGSQQFLEKLNRYDASDGSSSLLVGSTLSGLSLGEISTATNSQLPSRSGSVNSMVSLYGTPNSHAMQELQGYFDPGQLKSVPNLNTLWGCCCVEELCRNEVNTFFVSPGSRSAPLAVGVVRSRHAKLHVAHDERGAGFLAVGYARATGRAAAIITSSGTAVANLLPAVVEASMDSLPVILLTADRPPELRDVGANQAIHQSGIFGTYSLWSKDVPCPSEHIPLRNLLSDVDYAVYRSGSGCVNLMSSSGYLGAGPVHLNMMFREKLAPDQQAWDRKYVTDVGTRWQRSLSPLTHYQASLRPRTNIRESDAGRVEHPFKGGPPGDLISILKLKQAGIIIVGGGAGCVRTEDEGLALYEIAEILGWPVISDVCGGMRFDRADNGRLVHYADQILTSRVVTQLLVPDAVLQFGERITSKRICGMISTASRLRSDDDEFLHVIVSNSTKRCDPSFTVNHRVQGDVTGILEELRVITKPLNGCTSSLVPQDHQMHENHAVNASKLMVLVEISEKVGNALQEMLSSGEKEDLTEPWCARVISECIPFPSGLFIGNSMPIRDFDAFGSGTPDGMKLRVSANRGASGIDGIISSGIGFGIGLNMDVTIVLGDMSMIHDLNALHLLRSEEKSIPIDVTVVVVNNGGGGIFSILPIAKHRDVFSPLFDTPHSVRFRKACEMFGVEYSAVSNVVGLRRVLRKRGEGRHRLIEAFVTHDHASNAALHQRLGAAVSQQVSSYFAAKT